MSDANFRKLTESQAQGASAVFETLQQLLLEQRDYHKLFDSRILKKKVELGLPLQRPASLQDVPEEHRKAVEEVYVSAAREAGELFLAQGDIPSAWMYLQVIREPDKVRDAIDQLVIPPDDYEQIDQIVQIALYQGVHPRKGVELMLKAHGTCSTITTLDQTLQSFDAQQRADCAKLMVRTLYDDLTESVRRSLEARNPMLPPGESLHALIAGRDWLFEGGNYHIDVSHLNAVVRFARSIETPAQELEWALDLAEYGSKLDPQLQYGGEPPFDDFYPAHMQFFRVLLDRQRDDALDYFRNKLEQEPDEQDKALLAYVLVDLLMRVDRLDEAVDLSAKYLTRIGDEASISFDQLCEKAGRLDVLEQVRQEQGDLVGYVSALLRS